MVASLKPRIANAVSDQLPSFISDSSENFVKFLEYYYEWLESDGNPMDFVRHILEQHDYDTADENYKLLMERGVLNNLPTSLTVDKSILVKNIKDIFRMKGTEDSFQFLLNALFEEKSRLKWGKNHYIKTSDSTIKSQQIIAIKRPVLIGTSKLINGKLAFVDIDTEGDFNYVPSIEVVRDDPDVIVPEIEYELSGSVDSLSIVNAGFDYTSATVTITGDQLPGGVVAQFTANILNGKIINFTKITGGSGYKSKPTVTITGNGFGASAKVNWSATLHHIDIIDGGSGWFEAPTIQFIGGTDTDNFGNKYANAEAYLTADEYGTIISATILNPGEKYQYKPTIKWDFPVREEAKVELITSGSKIVGAKVLHPGKNYINPPIIQFSSVNYDYNDLIGKKITQLVNNSYSLAVVDTVIGYTYNSQEYFILKLQKEGLKGEFISGYSVISDGGLTGVVTPLFTGVDVLNSGSCYQVGDEISFDDEGFGGKLIVESVNKGSVDELLITKPGSGYQVGDNLEVGGTVIGTGFEAEVSAIDGQGAKIEAVLELDDIIVTNTGYNYQVNDEILIYGGSKYNTNTTSELAKIKVTAIANSDMVKSINVVNSGSKYQYASLAIISGTDYADPLRVYRPSNRSYKTAAFTPVATTTCTRVGNLATINAAGHGLTTNDLVSIKGVEPILYNGIYQVTVTDIDNFTFTLPVYGTSSATVQGTVTKILASTDTLTNSRKVTAWFLWKKKTVYQKWLENGKINFVQWNIADPDLNTTPTTIIVNGVGGSATASLTTGSITSATIVNAGVNYVSPKIRIIDSTGKNADLRAKINDIGQIIGINIINGGTGYTSPTLQIYEEFGTGAVLSMNFEKGAVSSFEVLNRGKFSEVDKYATPNYTLIGGSGKGLELDLYYRIRNVNILDQGKYYSDYTITTTNGHGEGVIMRPTIVGGIIQSIDVKDGGSHYHPDCLLELSNIGSGVGAILSPVIENGTLQSVTVIYGGANYANTTSLDLVYDEGIHDPDPYPVFHGIAGARTDGTYVWYTNKIVVTLNNHGLQQGEQAAFLFSGTATDGNYNITYLTANTFSVATTTIGTPEIGTVTVTPVTTYNFNGGSTLGAVSPIWPLSNSGLINSIFQIVDFVDVWPQTYNFPKDASYVVDADDFGQINNIKLISPGSGYYSNTERTPLELFVTGDGTGAELKPIVSNGGIVDIIVLDGGQNYIQSTTTVTSLGGQLNGTAAVFVPTVENGTITHVSISNPGTGYFYGTKAEITGDGENALLNIEVNTGITRVEIVNPGSGFFQDSETLIVTDIAPPSVTTGSGGELKAIFENGSVVAVQIINSGSGYHLPNQIVIVSSGGTDATIYPYADRPISHISLINPGKNYTNASVSIIGDGIGAKASAEISQTSLKNVIVPYGGNRYTKLPTLTITDNSNFGSVSKVKIKDGGSGYSTLPILTLSPRVLSKVISGGTSGTTTLILDNTTGLVNGMTVKGTGIYPGSKIITIVNSTDIILSNELVDTATGYAIFTHASAEVVSYSKSIGKINSIKFNEFAVGNISNPMIKFPISGLVTENAAFKLNELVYVKNYVYPNSDYTQGPHAYVADLDYDRNLLTLKNASEVYNLVSENGLEIVLESGTNQLNTQIYKNVCTENSFYIGKGNILVGELTGSEGKLLRSNRAYGTSVLSGLGRYSPEIKYSQSISNDKLVMLHDNKKFQDFAYSIITGIDENYYRSYIDSMVHPAGYRMFGEIEINTELDSKVKLPYDEITGEALYSLLILKFELEQLSLIGNQYDVWRIENDPISDHENNTIIQMEAIFDDLYQNFNNKTGGVIRNVTYPSEITVSEDLGIGLAYSITGTTLTVTLSSGHDVIINDKLKLNFTTGSGVDGFYVVTNVVGDNISAISTNLTTSGVVNVEKITNRFKAHSDIQQWKENVYYEMNDMVEITHDQIYYALDGHLSTSLNKPYEPNYIEAEYVQSGTTVTVTKTAHGLTNSTLKNFVFPDSISDTDSYVITVTDLNTFEITVLSSQTITIPTVVFYETPNTTTKWFRKESISSVTDEYYQ